MYTSGNPEGYRPFWLRCPDGTAFVRAIEIQPNKAYVISMPNSPTYLEDNNIPGDVAFTATNVQVMATPEDMPAEAVTAFTLVPAMRKIKGGEQKYVLNRQPIPAINLVAGEAFVRNGGEVQPFRAYASPKQNHGVAPYFLIGHEENGLTAITRPSLSAPKLSGAAYDITGRKLTGGERGLQIINHKKVIVK